MLGMAILADPLDTWPDLTQLKPGLGIGSRKNTEAGLGWVWVMLCSTLNLIQYNLNVNLPLKIIIML